MCNVECLKFRERRDIMKTMNKMMRKMMVVALLMLMGAAQAKAVEYKSTYRGVRTQPVYGIATTAAAPSTSFQSTSAYSGQWSNETSEALLNNDGSVNSGAYMTSGPNRAKNDVTPPLPPNPDPTTDPNDTGNVPLGEGVLALMFLACAYAISKVSRRRRILRG